MDEHFETLNIAHFNQLLTEIVAKLVSHDVRKDVEHHLKQASGKSILKALDLKVILELLLNHSASSLIKCKHINLLDNVELLGRKLLSLLFCELSSLLSLLFHGLTRRIRKKFRGAIRANTS